MSRSLGARFVLVAGILASAPACNLTGLTSAGADESGLASIPGCESIDAWTDEGARLEALTIERINAERRIGGRCGDTVYPPQAALRIDPALTCAARLYSRDMQERAYVSPIDPDGNDVGARLAAVGYDYRVWAAAIGAGWTRADDAVDSWLQSPNHCWKLFAREIHEIGVGVDAEYAGDTGLPEADTDAEVYPTYWTLVVGAQR